MYHYTSNLNLYLSIHRIRFARVTSSKTAFRLLTLIRVRVWQPNRRMPFFLRWQESPKGGSVCLWCLLDLGLLDLLGPGYKTRSSLMRRRDVYNEFCLPAMDHIVEIELIDGFLEAGK